MSNIFGALDTGDSDSETDEKLERQPKKEVKDAGKVKVAPVKTEPLPKSAADLKAREQKQMKDKKQLPDQKKYEEKHHNNNTQPVKAGEKKHHKREFERRSGTGRGKEVSKSGAGGNNWGKDAEKDIVADVVAAEAPIDGEEAPTAEAAAAPVEPEEPQGMTLEEYEALKAQKRQGKAFEELAKRSVETKIKGTAYKKEEKKEEFFIKLSNDDQETPAEVKAKKEARAGTQRLELNVLPSAPKREFSDSPRGAPRGGRNGPRPEGGAPRGGGRSGPRPEGGAPRGGSDRPRGGAPRGGAPRGGASSFRGSRGGIDTQDAVAFPKLGA